MKQILLVASRELSVTIRRKAYIFTVLGGPILFVAIYGIAILAAALTAGRLKPSAIAVVDSSGVLKPAVLQDLSLQAQQWGLQDSVQVAAVTERLAEIPRSTLEQTMARYSGFRRASTLFLMADADSAREAARRGDIDGALIVSRDYMASGRVWGYGRSESIFDDEVSPSEQVLRTALVLSLLSDQGIDPDVERRVLNPMNLSEFELREAGETAGEFEEKGAASAMRQFALPYGFSILLMMAIFMSGGFLLQGVAEEKENRVIEILLSTVTTDNLLRGKILGLGAAGLLQIFVWLGMAFGMLSFASIQFMPNFSVTIGPFLYALAYFILGFLLFSSLMAGVGSLGNTVKESQQLTTFFTLPAILPVFMLMPVILEEPTGFVARLLSYIPITSPFAMMMRMPTEQVPWWELPLTMLILVVSTLVAIWLGARLFRLGVLMYGKRPTVPEIFKWLRKT